MLELYYNEMSICAQTVRLLLAEKGLNYTENRIDFKSGEQFSPEYTKLNPRMVVPTLVHNDHVITESTIINEYLDDSFPETPFKPTDPLEQARMREWTKQIDESIFNASATVSIGIALRHTFNDTFFEHVEKIRGVDALQRIKQISLGLENPMFAPSIRRLYKLVTDIDHALKSGNIWLLGDKMTLADIGLVAYITRLEHLSLLEGMTKDKPNINRWYKNIQQRETFNTVFRAPLPEQALTLFKTHGQKAWPDIKEMLSI